MNGRKPSYFHSFDLRSFFVEEALILHFSGIYLTLSSLFEKSSSCLQMHHVVQWTTIHHELCMLGMCVIRPTSIGGAATVSSSFRYNTKGGRRALPLGCVCYVCGLGCATWVGEADKMQEGPLGATPHDNNKVRRVARNAFFAPPPPPLSPSPLRFVQGRT